MGIALMTFSLRLVLNHPRVRGERKAFCASHPRAGGPSPHRRGALGVTHEHPLALGTIPACAGSTPVAQCIDGSWWDHPRAGGEHLSGRFPIRPTRGPSPRGRGAPRSPRRAGSPRGTIPARAGSTCVAVADLPGLTDHPRAGGEHPSGASQMRLKRGPSPRGRGAQSTTCELTKGKQPFFQLLQRRTCTPPAPKPQRAHLPPKRRLFDALLHPLFGGLRFSSTAFFGRCIRVNPSWSTGSQWCSKV